jgi:hypothetical protein
LLEAAVTAIVSSVRRDGAGLATVADPLEAELFVSGILAMWRATALQGAEPLEVLGAAVMQRLASQADPDTLAVLLAIASMALPPFDAPARAAAELLRRAGTPQPIWSRSIGRPVLVDAWISTDELDDQSNLLAAFAYEHRPPHAINLIIDANFGGLIRGVFVADNPDKVRRDWTNVSGLPIRPLDEQALAAAPLRALLRAPKGPVRRCHRGDARGGRPLRAGFRRGNGRRRAGWAGEAARAGARRCRDQPDGPVRGAALDRRAQRRPPAPAALMTAQPIGSPG